MRKEGEWTNSEQTQEALKMNGVQCWNESLELVVGRPTTHAVSTFPDYKSMTLQVYIWIVLIELN